MSDCTIIHPTLTHPHTGEPLRAVGYTKRGPIWPVLGASDDDGGSDDGGAPPTGGTPGDWKPPASQADLDRIIQQRLDRERKNLTAQFADYDTFREKAEQFDALADSVKTDTERAVEEAREAAWQSAMAHAVPRVVSAEFKAEAARLGIGGEQLDAVLEDLDLYKYATDDGDPDVERIGKKLAAFAPAQPQRRTGPSPSGLGNRGGDVNPTPKDIASSFLAKRFPSTAAKAR